MHAVVYNPFCAGIIWIQSLHVSSRTQLGTDLTRFKEYLGPAAVQFVSWIMPANHNHLLPVGICRVSPVYQWLCMNSCLLLSASLMVEPRPLIKCTSSSPVHKPHLFACVET